MEEIKIVGIKVKTTNQNGQSYTKDIPSLWGEFYKNQISDKIANKKSSSVYCVYTEYESDYMAPYSVVIGHRVEDFSNVPEGLSAITIPAGNYQKFTSKGNIKECIYQTWQKIWNSDIQRAYTADYELYGEKAQNPEDAEVDIFVATL
ncbi:GyrI-like domain-containing protein [bacterium]|nr:GyrI-like domain-containing protein [bacterium]